MADWNSNEIPTLEGKTALVTGANSGLGLETAKALAAHGAQVILTCRNAAKAKTAMDHIQAAHPESKLDFVTLDLASLESVRQCVNDFQSQYSRLDILCNNAGVMGLPKSKTQDEFETIFGVNTLGHFALSGLLFDVLNSTPGARVVTLSSRTHRSASLPLDDLNWEGRRYSRAGAYGQSKLANLIFTLELDRRLRERKADFISVAAHPGYAATNVVFPSDAEMTLGRRIWDAMATLGNKTMAQSAAQGALPTLYATTMPDVRGGEYYGPDGIAEFRGYPIKITPAPIAQDPVLARKLWQQCEALTGVSWL